jgi:uncharacterized protein YeaO (DUF488 family)
MVTIRRAYDPSPDHEGRKYLVDRLWPRGVRKEDLGLDAWLKEIAPSADLHKWFAHDPDKWEEFRERFRRELKVPEKEQILWKLVEESRRRTITLIFATRDRQHNNAVVIKELIEEMVEGAV